MNCNVRVAIHIVEILNSLFQKCAARVLIRPGFCDLFTFLARCTEPFSLSDSAEKEPSV